MEKKYKLTEETINVEGTTLYRIEAIKDFGDVKKGEKGGYVENEDNLSHYDNCWVYENAMVCGKAKVYDNAKIYDKAVVCDNARIYDNAKVYGNAQVYDYAEVWGNAVVYDNAKVFGDMEVYD